MKMKNVIAGLRILEPYYDGEYNLGAEHETLYAFTTSRPVAPEDVKKLHELGWRQEHIGPGRYDPDETWSAAV